MKNRYHPREKHSVTLFLIFALIVTMTIGMNGCAKLQPNADPLIVRAEQTEATAKASFDLVLRTDNADRGFWRTNAPAFHSFCEWLRQPQPVWQTNTLPRASAMIANVNNIKLDYREAKASSNALITALLTLTSAANQASAWSTIVTNR